MPRKKKAPSGPNNGYLISFGDTMTALLAFFIVLNSLATEQTGANLHAGTGSFQSVGEGLGVPGLFPSLRSQYAAQQQHSSPMYIIEGDDPSDLPGDQPTGPDKDGDVKFVRDRENDDMHRFLSAMQLATKATYKKPLEGEVAFDRLNPLNKEELMDSEMKQDLLKLAPTLRRKGYELEIRVWATTPAPSAWQRAAEQANVLHRETIKFLKLRGASMKKVSAGASPWFSSEIKRPTLSFLVRRVGDR